MDLKFIKAGFVKILILSSFFVSCEQNNSKNKNLTTLLSIQYLANANKSSCNPAFGEFWARNLSSPFQNSYCVSSTRVAFSTNIDLYLENGLSTNLNYQSVVNSFESNIYPVLADAFGTVSDVNKDGRITVLILNIKDGATSTSGFVAGFVDPANFYSDISNNTIRSNQREILYMDGVELLQLRDKNLANGKPDIFLSTLAHELQHLIRFQFSQGTDDTWIDEGTSEVTSDLTGYGPQTGRISCFKGDSNSSISCTGGIGSTSTGNPSLFNWASNLKNYAYAYSFMKYMYEISGNTTSSKNAFFRNTVRGINGIRANNAYNFMSVFMNSANFNSSVLTSDNKTAFKRIFASFLGQAVGYPNLNTVYFGNTSVVNIDSVRTTYPLPPDLSTLPNPTFPAISKPSSINLDPSQTSRISGTTSGITSSSPDFVIVSNASNEFIIFNGDHMGSKSTVSSASFDVMDSVLEYPELDLHTGDEIICPNEHFKKILNIEKVKYNLKLYKQEKKSSDN